MPPRTHVGYIGPAVMVRGRVSGDGSLHVDGRVDGNIALAADLFIGASGSVSAERVSANSVTVDGFLEADVSAGAVAVRSGGCIEGDVRARSVAIDDGARVQGTIDMDFELPSDIGGTRADR